ncbi:isochorismate synthase [Vespertiliibacter pulmonis]|uniref:Isochorismate synthase MenF n=1 Tax=Vespertiliibacter pulmonis TaxID=1443036 RepID=A0A3N4VL40_9PAST|nr:isochorismate synthase [Vespertiliibacter pulmonis]QLB21088.1 isochorismate synthase [Vespertiliibacter pulmonis]RPE83812.1 isochorismate synthase [Vespertiliibacter pulmonis]
MSLFTELKQKLSQQLDRLPNEQAGLIELKAKVTLENRNLEINLLSWLKGQSTFPQYFWQSRDQQLTFATIGTVIQFDEISHAQHFSQQTGFRLFGGIKFEGQCHFILPRLVLTKKSDQLTACLYVNPQEKSKYIELIDQLEYCSNVHSIFPTHILSSNKVSDFPRWEDLLQNAIQAIKQQQFCKVVLANATTLTVEEPISAYDLLTASQQKNTGCYHFLWAENANSTFIGSSPECLYQRNGRQLQTEALAGTVAVTQDLNQTEHNRLWLLNDKKNIHENQLVVDDIQQHLQDCCDDISINEIEIKKLHNVQHLRRKIQATLHPTINDADCLTRIHPTAAVAGLPRSKALAFISYNEGFTRGWYAAAFGSFSQHSSEFCVALRSGLVSNNQITFYAGAGIVEDSQAQSEWQEIERKALALASLLQ